MLIDGHALALQTRKSLRARIEHEGLDVGLAAVLVGNNEASQLYVSLKERAATKMGMRFERVDLDEQIDQQSLINAIETLNSRDDIHGILIQLPLPEHLDTQAIINTMSPAKDADGFHPVNTQKFLKGDRTLWPVLTKVVMRLIESTEVNIEGKTACIIANNPDIFAPPLEAALGDHQISTTSIKPNDENLEAQTKNADIIIVAIGRTHFIKPSMIKEGAILIDIGINKTDDGIAGDVDPAVDNIAAWRSPVPGGVGPMTVATLLENVVLLSQRQSIES